MKFIKENSDLVHSHGYRVRTIEKFALTVFADHPYVTQSGLQITALITCCARFAQVPFLEIPGHLGCNLCRSSSSEIMP
jgi:hypothetical protein